MRKYFLCMIALFPLSFLFAQNASIPHIERTGNAIKLIVKDRPFIILGGELHNSSTSGADYMRPIWDNMKRKNLNTVIAAAYWELLEPQEGKFDFTLVDSMIYGARKSGLHLVILWFGSWKNGYSMYAPAWVKNNFNKYPRARDKNGKSMQMLSSFGEASMLADAAAFKAMMQHVRQVDADYQTVIAVQVENEMGLFGTAREYSDAANKAYNAPVPEELMKYLSSHRNNIQPEIDSVWKANGYKTTGTWEEVFGKSIFEKNDWKALSYLTEELFTVYHYAKYVGTIAAEGKKAYPLPMYVNAWIKQDGFAWPGRYPAGGPIPHTLDIWRAAAPALDFISPDIYINDVNYTLKQYHRKGNPVFIPEIKPGIQAANEAFWAFGEEEALSFSPFGIDESDADADPITKTYAVLKMAQDFIIEQYGKGTMRGIYLDSPSKKQDFEMGGYKISAQSGGSFADLAGLTMEKKKSSMAGGMLISTGKDEFLAIGKDFYLRFTPVYQDDSILDIEYMDEGVFVDNKWKTIRRLNGDEGTGGGDYGFGFGNPRVAILRFPGSPTGDYSIIKIKIYKYK